MTLLPAEALKRVKERLQTVAGWPSEVYVNRGRLAVWQTVVNEASGRVIANLLHGDPEELAELITHKTRQVEFQQGAVIEFLARHDDDQAREAMIQEAMGNVLNGIAPKDESGKRDYRLGGMVDMLDIDAVTREGVAVDGSPGVSGFRFRITLLMTAESLLGENLDERVTAVIEPILMSGTAEVLRGNLLAAEVDPILSAAAAEALAQLAGAPGVDHILGTGEADIELSGNAAGVIGEILGSGNGELRIGVASSGVIDAILGSGSVDVPQSGTNGAMLVDPILGSGAARALLAASASANVEAILGTGAISAGSGAGLSGWIDPVLGAGQTDLLISGNSGAMVDAVLGSGGVAVALEALGGGNVEAILASGQAGQPVNTANGGGNVESILATGEADALVTANAGGVLDPVLGVGQTDLLISGDSAGAVEAVLGSGASVVALTANSAGVLDPILSASAIAVDVNATGAGFVDPILGAGDAGVSSGLSGSPAVEPIISAADAAVLAAANGSPSVAPILGSGAGAALIQGQSPGGSVMSILGTGAGIVVGGGSNEPETDALIAAMTVAPDATREGLINDLIAGAKSDGWWSKLEYFLSVVAHDQQAATLDWLDPTRVAVLGGGTFTVDQGYYCTSSGGINKIQPAWTWGDRTIAAVANSHIGTFILSCTSGGNEDCFEMFPTNGFGRVEPANNVISRTFKSGFTSATALTDREDLHVVDVNDGTARMYADGVAGGTNSQSNRSFADTDAPRHGLDMTVGAVHFGSALTATDVANIDSRLRTFFTAIGAI